MEDLVYGIDLIHAKIKEMSSLTVGMIKERLRNKDYHIKLLEKNRSLEGIFIWYGAYDDFEDCYLWLGAVGSPGNGAGSLLMNGVLDDMKKHGYCRVHVKAKTSNDAATAVLRKYGFSNIFIDDKGISYLFRDLQSL
ncbi:MAG: GNAT family N-acetyltransferase [Candidatus Nanoarchaeia archaeon]|nr:GNAT family N-acetyltransferase [Candidatus Nanoarchaeia archaeon]